MQPKRINKKVTCRLPCCNFGQEKQSELMGCKKITSLPISQDTKELEKSKELQRGVVLGLRCESDDSSKRRKMLPITQVFQKCKTEEDDSKSLGNSCEVKASFLVHDGHAERKLNLEHPIFVRLLQRSNTTVGFLLSLPKPFCRKYLPKEDTTMMLETETEEIYEAKYIPRISRLSGGWRRFAIQNKLVEGDVAVFQLVEATRFKVYLIRKNTSSISHRLSVRATESVVTETIGIDFALSSCNLPNFMDNFEVWDKTLCIYKSLGVNVDFLHARLLHLRNVAFSSEGVADRCRLKEAIHERECTESEVMKLELILAKFRAFYDKLAVELKTSSSKVAWEDYTEACSKIIRVSNEISKLEEFQAEFVKFFEQYDAIIESLRLKAKKHEQRFDEEICVPW